MAKTIIELSNNEVRRYFLQSKKYCTIDLPMYFDFQPLLDKLDKQIGNKEISSLQDNTPSHCDNVNYKFFTNKDGKFSWRPFQIINPVIYIIMVNKISDKENWEIIKKCFTEFQKDNKIECHSIPLQIETDTTNPKPDVARSINNWWEKIEQRSIELALEYDCVLITDITDCYSSIYTHSIEWAFLGKDKAKIGTKSYDKEVFRKKQELGKILDKLIRMMSYGQTNGIPQGSALMDFIAEIILGYADKELSLKIANNINYKILRYRDDYRIFTRTQEEAVKIAKMLTEVLLELNLKLNTQKTLVTDDIISNVIKPDKIFWGSIKAREKSLQKQLLLIHSLAEKYPNSGSISAALSKFINNIYPVKVMKDNNPLVLISILVDIAYNNPRTYSAVIVCIGKIMSLETDPCQIELVYDLIKKKFQSKPNVGHWKVWFQRLTIKTNRELEINSDEKLCQIAANKKKVQLWNVSWLKKEYQLTFTNNKIFNEEIFHELDNIPDKSEVQIFKY